MFQKKGSDVYVLKSLAGKVLPKGTQHIQWVCDHCGSLNEDEVDHCGNCGVEKTPKVYQPLDVNNLPANLLRLLADKGMQIKLPNNKEIDPAAKLAELENSATGRSSPRTVSVGDAPSRSRGQAERPQATAVPAFAHALLQSRAFRATVATVALVGVMTTGALTYMTAPYKQLEGVVVEKVIESHEVNVRIDGLNGAPTYTFIMEPANMGKYNLGDKVTITLDNGPLDPSITPAE